MATSFRHAGKSQNEAIKYGAVACFLQGGADTCMLCNTGTTAGTVMVCVGLAALPVAGYVLANAINTINLERGGSSKFWHFCCSSGLAYPWMSYSLNRAVDPDAKGWF